MSVTSLHKKKVLFLWWCWRQQQRRCRFCEDEICSANISRGQPCDNKIRGEPVVYIQEQGSSVSIVSDYRLDWSGFDPRQGQRILLLTSVSRPALRPTQPPVQCAPGGPFTGAKHGRGVTLTTNPHLTPRSRMSRSYSCSPPKRHHGV
jgi:hypothetical protein